MPKRAHFLRSLGLPAAPALPPGSSTSARAETELDLGVLVVALRLLGEIGDATFEAVEVGEHQLGFNRVDVGDRLDPALDMGDVGSLETSHHMDDRVDLADGGEELVAETFALRCAADQPGDVDEVIWVAMFCADFAISDSLSRRGSGTATSPTFGSIVQNG